MTRLLGVGLLLLAFLPLASAEICTLPPLVNVTPVYAEGPAGSIQALTLTIQNPNFWWYCPQTYTVSSVLHPVLKRFDPTSNVTNVTVPPQNQSRNFTFSFSSLANTTAGNYSVAFTVTGYSFETLPHSNSTTGYLWVTAPTLLQPDLTITAVGWHCFDHTGLPRAQCYLYDTFSLDNITVANVGNRDYPEPVYVEATDNGPNLTGTFLGTYFSNLSSNESRVLNVTGKGITTFALAAAYTIRLQLYPKGVEPELSTANNEYSFQVSASTGYPPGCAYSNPPCSLGSACRDNTCVPVATPTFLPFETATPEPSPNATDQPAAGATALPTLDATEIHQLRNQSAANGENVSEVDSLINESYQLQSQGKLAEALAKIDQVRQRVKSFEEKANSGGALTLYLYVAFGFLVVLIALIGILVIRRKSRKDDAPPETGADELHGDLMMPDLTAPPTQTGPPPEPELPSFIEPAPKVPAKIDLPLKKEVRVEEPVEPASESPKEENPPATTKGVSTEKGDSVAKEDSPAKEKDSPVKERGFLPSFVKPQEGPLDKKKAVLEKLKRETDGQKPASK